MSSYVSLNSTGKTDGEAVADGIERWIQVFKTLIIWVSDNDSNFKNRVMNELDDVHRIKQHFTAADLPWVNDTVKRCMRHIKAVNRCLRSELKLGTKTCRISQA